MKITARTGEHEHEVTIARENGHYAIELDGVRRLVDARKLEGDFYSILWEGRSYEVSVEPAGDGYRVRHGAAECRVSFSDPSRPHRNTLAAAAGPLEVAAVMPGKVVRLLVVEGDTVERGQGLAVLEAMKMENEITAPRAGRVRGIAVQPGQVVESGASLLVLE